jgi:glutathione S-transferase
MVRKIWGRLSSVNVQKVVWAAEELGLPYARIDAGGAFGQNRTPEYLAMNPNGLVPVLQEDGFVLWESHAILRYLGATHPSPLWSSNAREAALLDRWLDWTTATLGEPMRVIFWALVRTKEAERDMHAVARAVDQAGTRWGLLETWFAGRSYLGGDRFTLADIPAGCFVHRWFSLPIARPHQPAVQAWYERLLERPAFAQYVARPLE